MLTIPQGEYLGVKKNTLLTDMPAIMKKGLILQAVLVRMHNAQQLHLMHNTYATGVQCLYKVQ